MIAKYMQAFVRSKSKPDDDVKPVEADPFLWASRVGNVIPTFLTAFDNEFVHFFKVNTSALLDASSADLEMSR